MADCSIELSKQDMKTLLRYVYLGDWVLRSTKDEPDPEAEEFLQKMLFIMKSHDIDPGITNEHGAYEVSPELEEECQDEIAEYDEDVFWDHLIESMARRDFFHKHKLEEIEAMEAEEYDEGISAEAEKYAKETEENGIENIGIVGK